MARSHYSSLRAVVVTALAAQAVAQQCYYPNGSKAPSTEKPCSSASGSACCPDTWECLDNGLCHLPSGNLYGRYSCTDQSWKSSGCPSNMCTYNMQASGGEGITQCSNHGNQWCCNADNVHVDCCQESPVPRPFFSLQNGQVYAVVGSSQASSQPSLASITGLATSSGGGSSSSASQTPAPQSSQGGGSSKSNSPASSSVQPQTSRLTSVSSGSAGVQTVVQTLIITPSSSPTAGSSSASATSKDQGSKSNIGLIVGCAVGIPAALALLGIVLWMLRKRRQQKVNPYGGKTADLDRPESPNSPGFAGGAAAKLGKKDVYRHSQPSRPGTTELDSAPAGPGRPVSNVPGHAELESGHGFHPGQTPYAPDTVGIGGGIGDGRSIWGTAPPGYSPGVAQEGFNHPEVAELDATSVMPVINEKEDLPQQYQAYRPPPAATELPTIKTPPEDLEKQLQK